jgi:hypothetical protein
VLAKLTLYQKQVAVSQSYCGVRGKVHSLGRGFVKFTTVLLLPIEEHVQFETHSVSRDVLGSD